MIRCCICGKQLPNFMCTNNPAGAAWKKDGKVELLEFGPEDRCCDGCNQKFVIPGRIHRMKLSKSENQEEE